MKEYIYLINFSNLSQLTFSNDENSCCLQYIASQADRHLYQFQVFFYFDNFQFRSTKDFILFKNAPVILRKERKEKQKPLPFRASLVFLLSLVRGQKNVQTAELLELVT